MDVLRPILVHAIDQIRGGDHPRADNFPHLHSDTHQGARGIADSA
jgi:hypothetical protein